ncbi:MAG: glycoside hydrolase family 38 C-terminal domain-containing protein [bacterium]
MNRTQFDRTVEAARARISSEQKRLTRQLEFARALIEMEPGKAGEWTPIIEKAEVAAMKAAAIDNLEEMQKAVKEIEGILAPFASAAKEYTIWCNGHAHIDMNWMWSWPETVAVTIDTFGTMLKLMEEFPDFTFAQSQASCYAIVEEHAPEMLDAIRARVKEGRWEVTASHWVEGDKNMAAGEALCRHLLYTREYMKKLFDLSPEQVSLDFQPDTFGHAATIPTYLVRGGVKRYYGHRFGHGEKHFPQVFWWEGPDGSRVLVCNASRIGYNGNLAFDNLPELFKDFVKTTGLKQMLHMVGVGDHGGGPTRRDIACLHEMNSWPIFPNIAFSTTEKFWQNAEAHPELHPVMKGELNFEFRGCYTTQTLVKKSNRHAENQLRDAEVAAVAGWGTAVKREYPTARLEKGWRDTLLSHFHDILPGSGILDTRTYCHGKFQDTVAMTGQVETQALRALAAQVDTSGVKGEQIDYPAFDLANGMGGGVGKGTLTGFPSVADQSAGAGPRPFVLWNPSPFAFSGTAQATIWDNDPHYSADRNKIKNRGYCAILPDGKRVACQVTDSGEYWGHQFVTLAFPVADIPGLGYKLATIIEGDAPAPEGGLTLILEEKLGAWYPSHVGSKRFGFENEFMSVIFDGVTGGIRSLVEKKSGRDLVDPFDPAGTLDYIRERAIGMSAWIRGDTLEREPLNLKSMEMSVHGPWLSCMEMKYERGENQFTVTWELRAGDPNLSVNITGNWVEIGTDQKGIPGLEFSIPTCLTDTSGRFEIPFGAVERASNVGDEVPGLRWGEIRGKLDGKSAGLLLANDSKYGYAIDGGAIRQTLIRSSYSPDNMPENMTHTIKLTLRPFVGELPLTEAICSGEMLNHPLRAIGTPVHGGKLSGDSKLLTVDGDTAVICGLKVSEDGSGLIVRLFDTTGKKNKAVINIDKILLGEVTGATEVDILERPTAVNSAVAKGNTVTAALPAFGITTVKISLNR